MPSELSKKMYKYQLKVKEMSDSEVVRLAIGQTMDESYVQNRIRIFFETKARIQAEMKRRNNKKRCMV